MTQTINAVYAGGVLRPLQPLDGIAEHAHVKLTVESADPVGNGLADCIGILPDEDATAATAASSFQAAIWSA